jgi:predicted metal-binding protein
MPKYVPKKTPKKFNFLIERAKEPGAVQAEDLIPVKIAVENRALLKCRTGCQYCGNKLSFLET